MARRSLGTERSRLESGACAQRHLQKEGQSFVSNDQLIGSSAECCSSSSDAVRQVGPGLSSLRRCLGRCQSSSAAASVFKNHQQLR